MKFSILGLVAIGVGFALFPTGAGAEEELDLEMEVFFAPEELPPDVVESASKVRQSIFWSPSAITVITRDEIRSSGANSFVDLLRRVPGFEVFELKPTYPVTGARGLTDESNNLVLVLVDGLETMKEFTGSTFWSGQPFDLEDIERVEVIRGPGSALYGANAFSAVINITTVHDIPGGGSVNITGGEQGRMRVHGKVHDRFNLGNGVLSFNLSAAREEMFTPSDPTESLLDTYRAHCWLRYRQGQDIDLSLHARVLGGEGLYYTHVVDLYLEDGLDYWIMGKGVFGLGDSVRLKTQVYFTRGDAKFHSRTSMRAMDIWIFDVPDFDLKQPVIDGQLQLDFQLTDDLLFIAGANLRYVTVKSNFYDPSTLEELRWAGFVQFNWTLWDELQITGGVRYDSSTEIDPAVSPRVALVYRPVTHHAFRLSYGLAFRKPSLYENQAHPKVEIYNPATPEIVDKMKSQMGNEDLVNEKVHSIEAGWQASMLEEQLQTALNLFFNIYRDAIFFDLDLHQRLGFPDIPNSTFRYENEDSDILAFGAEAEVSWKPSDRWRLWGNLSFRNLMSQAENPTPDKDELVWLANLGGSYQPDSGIQCDVAIHYVSGYHLTVPNPENNFDPPVYYEMGNQVTLIGRLGYRVNLSEVQMLEAGLTVRTPLGAPFQEYPGFPMDRNEQSRTTAYFGGDFIYRVASFYLRWNF